MRLSERCVFLFLPLAVVLAFVSAAADDSSKKPKASKANQEQTQKYVRPTDPSLYVGSETCKTCHEDMPTKGFYKSYEDSPHFATARDTKRGPECFSRRNQRALPRLPSIRRRTQQLWPLGAPTKQRWLHGLPRPAPCQREPIPHERKAAVALLRLPLGNQATVHSNVPSPCQ